tara:strand:- start:877 stop:1347 length:471 start_codon:yes stop_codon:yes gene_type:complete
MAQQKGVAILEKLMNMARYFDVYYKAHDLRLEHKMGVLIPVQAMYLAQAIADLKPKEWDMEKPDAIFNQLRLVAQAKNDKAVSQGGTAYAEITTILSLLQNEVNEVNEVSPTSQDPSAYVLTQTEQYVGIVTSKKISLGFDKLCAYCRYFQEIVDR